MPGHGVQVLTLAEARAGVQRPLTPADRHRGVPLRQGNAVAPILPLPSAPTASAPGPMDPETYRRLAAVVDSVMARATGKDLPPLTSWRLDTADVLYGKQPTASGQLFSGLFGEDREEIAQWAVELGGTVTEYPHPGYTRVEAQGRVAGALVVIWAHAYPAEAAL
ncbi:hypothetical protein [Peterkaempfera griseoplana]|uniref:hypothetical protein n=1 Tax=Peterkaempfera griseoplana TaxID=66896 RepID=UPI0006E3B9DC|nr:hypothetical protein [Peterkaempfera griseoplana]